jgi:hypothetical protein
MDEESQQQQGVTSDETPATPGGESNSQVSKEEYDRIVNDYENVKKALQDERNGKKKTEEDESSQETDEEEEKKRIQHHLREEYLKETVEAKTEGSDEEAGNRVQKVARAILATDLPEGYDRKTIQSAVDRALRAEGMDAPGNGSQTTTPSPQGTQEQPAGQQSQGTGATDVAAATSGSAPSTPSAGDSTPSKVEVSQQTAQELRAKGLNVEEHQQRLERFYERGQYDQIRMHGGVIRN